MKVIAGAAALYLVLRLVGFHKLFENDTEGIGALLQIIGTLYSVVYAFAIYVIWGQFTSVENEILKEAGTLKDLLIFSQALKETAREAIVRAAKTYSRGVAETEWRSLAEGEETDKTDKLFLAVISSVTDLKPADDTERVLYQHLLAIANQASAHRDERISLSIKRMPRTLLAFVTLTASMILFLLFFFPFRNLALGLVSIAVTTMLLFFADFVLTDLDNPFEGTGNVGSEPFAKLVTKSRQPFPRLQWLNSSVTFPHGEPAMTDPASNCLFCRILRGEIPAKKVFEDEQVFAFEDINPQAPTHVLVIPKKHFAGLREARADEAELIGRCHLAAAEIARQRKIEQGYRTVLNVGPGAGQSVFHLHVHLLGGRSLGWPPG